MARSTQAELERIEELLDEDFESISQARKALKADTGATPYKKSYTVRELSSKRHRTVRTFVTDVENRTGEIDALKHPQDFWAAEIYGHGTYQLYGSAEQLARKLGTYKGLQEEHPEKALKNIKIIRVSGVNAVQDYYKQKKEQVAEQWRKRKREHKLDRARQRKQKKQIEKQSALIKAQRAQIKKQEREMQKQAKEIKRLRKS